MSQTTAEILLAEADRILHPRSALILGAGWSAETLATAAVAIRFKRLGPSAQLRAIVEGWNLDRIVREVNR